MILSWNRNACFDRDSRGLKATITTIKKNGSAARLSPSIVRNRMNYNLGSTHEKGIQYCENTAIWKSDIIKFFKCFFWYHRPMEWLNRIFVQKKRICKKSRSNAKKINLFCLFCEDNRSRKRSSKLKKKKQSEARFCLYPSFYIIYICILKNSKNIKNIPLLRTKSTRCVSLPRLFPRKFGRLNTICKISISNSKECRARGSLYEAPIQFYAQNL